MSTEEMSISLTNHHPYPVQHNIRSPMNKQSYCPSFSIVLCSTYLLFCPAQPKKRSRKQLLILHTHSPPSAVRDGIELSSLFKISTLFIVLVAKMVLLKMLCAARKEIRFLSQTMRDWKRRRKNAQTDTHKNPVVVRH